MIGRTTINKISQIDEISSVVQRLYLKELKEGDINLLCRVILIFYSDYQKDKRALMYLEMSYTLALKLYLYYRYEPPLLDICAGVGYYPIIDAINNEDMTLKNISRKIAVDYNKVNEVVYTEEQIKAQKKIRNNILNSNILFNAPTSYGKSEIVSKLVNEKIYSKIVYIIPTKSLLNQVFNDLKEKTNHYSLAYHPDMINGNENNLLCIFTQERYMLALQDTKVLPDLLILDEAHNEFSSQNRSIITSRVIEESVKKNKNIRLLYLSPLVDDAKNLEHDLRIEDVRINYNMKSPKLIYKNEDKGQYQEYNKFFDKYYDVNVVDEYISKGLHMYYLYSPRNIEQYASDLKKKVKISTDKILNQIAYEVEKALDSDYSMIEYIQHGIIYMHGQVPDNIRYYLESKLKEETVFNSVVANSVFVEGMNFSIDKLTILNTRGLTKKKMENLIGRVNRLNYIFGKNNDLSLLEPQIIFEDTLYQTDSMKKKIELFSKIQSKDEVKNPLLKTTDEKKDDEKTKKIKDFEELRKIDKNIEVIAHSSLEVNYSKDDLLSLSKRMNTAEQLELLDEFPIEEAYKRIINYAISLFLINDNDLNLKRLSNEKAVNYYVNYIKAMHTIDYKTRLAQTIAYWSSLDASDDMYIGNSFGMYARGDLGGNVFVDFKGASKKEKVNYAIIKIEMENKFVKYTLNRMIKILKDINLITEDAYNLFVYGTSDLQKLKLLKLGLDNTTIMWLIENDLLKEINFDKRQICYIDKKYEYLLKEKNEVEIYGIKKIMEFR